MKIIFSLILMVIFIICHEMVLNNKFKNKHLKTFKIKQVKYFYLYLFY